MPFADVYATERDVLDFDDRSRGGAYQELAVEDLSVPAATKHDTVEEEWADEPDVQDAPELTFGGIAAPSESRRSFSIAAALTAVALLGVAALAVIYMFSILHKRNLSPPPAPTPAVEGKSQPAVQKQPEIVVALPEFPETDPQQPVLTAPERPEAVPEHKAEASRSDALAKARGPNSGRAGSIEPRAPEPPNASTRPRSVTSEPRVDPPVVRPRVDWDRLSSRLLSSRSSRTARGLHYELTFSLQDQSGRHAFLRGLTVSTRSSGGAVRSQSLPFNHRLGARGALTFTVGIDMPGRKPPDWQGHVSLLVTGTDSTGKAVESRFAAPLHP
jgi:hypothetical protein